MSDLEINETTMLASIEQQIKAHESMLREPGHTYEFARTVCRTVLQAPLSEIEYLRSQVDVLQETIRSLRVTIADHQPHEPPARTAYVVQVERDLAAANETIRSLRAAINGEREHAQALLGEKIK